MKEKQIKLENIFDITKRESKTLYYECFEKIKKREKVRFNSYDKPRILVGKIYYEEVVKPYMICTHWDEKTDTGYKFVFEGNPKRNLLSPRNWKLICRENCNYPQNNSVLHELESPYNYNKTLSLVIGEDSSKLYHRTGNKEPYTSWEQLKEKIK